MENKNQPILCRTCSFCQGIRPAHNTRTGFFCEHPEQSYINAYFVQHNMKKMPGFLGYGAVYSNVVPIKTAPAWCPLKKPQTN